MKNMFSTVTALFLATLAVSLSAHADPASGVEATRDLCIQNDGGTNPGTITCDQAAIKEADQLITSAIARYKKDYLSGQGQAQALLDQAQSAFEQYRADSAQVAGIADGGTGSDRETARQEAAWKLTIVRLRGLQDSFGN